MVIFAVIVGDVGNMVTTMNLKRSEFEDHLDGCKKVHEFLQQKAIGYFGYIWQEGQAQVDEEEIADFLPPRLYGQIAVHIHMETLRRVKLFENCDPSLLFELILKLQLQVYSPMDYVCKKGEVGKEMYIVKSGFVEVVSEDGSKVFVRLGEGTVFGELSILNIPGNKNGNRRTANVRSVGFSDLYTLQKEDLWDALKDYPDAKESLLEKGRELLAKDNLIDEQLALEEDPYDNVFDVEDALAIDAKAVAELEKSLVAAEQAIHDSQVELKQRITMLERELDEEIRAWKAAGRPPLLDGESSSSEDEEEEDGEAEANRAEDDCFLVLESLE